jgi:TPR repeat protein
MKGHGRAAYNLGVMYRDGNSVRRDRAAAIRFFRLAARNGIPAAQANLDALGAPAEPPSAESGQSLVASRPAVAGSDVEAVARFQKAVLARVTLDRSEAKDFSDYVAIFTREAAKGDHLAQYDLGFALQHGLGIRADPVRAYVYYTRAMTSKASDIYAAALTGASEIVTLLNNKQFTAAHEMLFNDTP